MVALVFLLVVTAVFASVLALEGGDPRFARRPAGLLSWIASGNWPAKIGGGLMIIGVGALLRYAAINFDVPDQYKLAVGIVAAAVLGIGSFADRIQSATPRDFTGARWRRVRCRLPDGIQRLRAVRLPAHPAGPGIAGAHGHRCRRVRRDSQRTIPGRAFDGGRVHRAGLRGGGSGSAGDLPLLRGHQPAGARHGRGARLAAADPPELPVHAGRQRILRVDRRLFLPGQRARCCCR